MGNKATIKCVYIYTYIYTHPTYWVLSLLTTPQSMKPSEHGCDAGNFYMETYPSIWIENYLKNLNKHPTQRERERE